MVPTLSNKSRALVIGNGGAGKTWLSNQLSNRLGLEAVHLDDIYWLDVRNLVRNPRNVAEQSARDAAAPASWVIEGAWGEIVGPVAARATVLIWLDFSVNECVRNVYSRPARDNAASTEAMVQWVQNYHLRDGKDGRVGHKEIYDSFGQDKTRIESRSQIQELLNSTRLADSS